MMPNHNDTGTTMPGHHFTEKGRHEVRKKIALFIALVSLPHSAVISISPLSQQIALAALFYYGVKAVHVNCGDYVFLCHHFQ